MAKIFGALVLVLILRQVQLYISVMRKISFYKKQGVTIHPHAHYPVVGNIPDMMKYDEVAAQKSEAETSLNPWIVQNTAELMGEPHYDGKKHPVLLVNFMGEVQLFVSDARICQEFMTTKNKHIDKTPLLWALLKPILGDGIIFTPRGENYKKKRKHIS